jgi:hypothetical protein
LFSSLQRAFGILTDRIVPEPFIYRGIAYPFLDKVSANINIGKGRNFSAFLWRIARVAGPPGPPLDVPYLYVIP